MATLMQENGADIRFIQAMLGHAELSTTEIDTQVAIKALKAIHEATHPARLRQHGGNRDGVDQAADADTAAAHALLAAFGREGETEG
jgi:integrase/recombinase XerD